MSKYSVKACISIYRDELTDLEARINALQPALAVIKSEDAADALNTPVEKTRPGVILSAELNQLAVRANDLQALIALLSSHCSAKA